MMHISGHILNAAAALELYLKGEVVPDPSEILGNSLIDAIDWETENTELSMGGYASENVYAWILEHCWPFVFDMVPLDKNGVALIPGEHGPYTKEGDFNPIGDEFFREAAAAIQGDMAVRILRAAAKAAEKVGTVNH